MSRRIRILAAAVCLLALIVTLVISVAPQPSPETVVSSSSSAALTNLDCKKCHQDVWDEWNGSMHADSWTSSDVQAAFQHFGHDRKCESCHAPVPVFLTGLQEPVEFRSSNRDEGVGCLSCHLLPDGSVAARATNADAPCRPVRTPELLSSLQCAGCHTAIYDDWKNSTYATDNKTCQTCHMPSTESRKSGFSHVCLGGHDDATVRSAATLVCEQHGAELVMTVTNTKAGHNFPGERHNRVLLIQVVETSTDGRILLTQGDIIKTITPFRGESSAEEIRAGESWEFRVPVEEGASLADVRLLYKRFPWISDHDALVVHREEVELK